MRASASGTPRRVHERRGYRSAPRASESGPAFTRSSRPRRVTAVAMRHAAFETFQKTCNPRSPARAVPRQDRGAPGSRAAGLPARSAGSPRGHLRSVVAARRAPAGRCTVATSPARLAPGATDTSRSRRGERCSAGSQSVATLIGLVGATLAIGAAPATPTARVWAHRGSSASATPRSPVRRAAGPATPTRARATSTRSVRPRTTTTRRTPPSRSPVSPFEVGRGLHRRRRQRHEPRVLRRAHLHADSGLGRLQARPRLLQRHERPPGPGAALQQFAATHNVKAVTVLIGANNFGFADIVQSASTDFLLSPSWWKDYCNDDSSVKAYFTASAVATQTTDIKGALLNVRQAMLNAGLRRQRVQDHRADLLVADPQRRPGSATRSRATPGSRPAAAGSGTRTPTGPTTPRCRRSTTR